MSKENRLLIVAEKALNYQRARQEAEDKYLEFLEALLIAYDEAPKQERAIQSEIANAIPIEEYDRGRIAQFIVKARKLKSANSSPSSGDT